MAKKNTTLQIPSNLFSTGITGTSSNISTTSISGTNLVYNGGSGITIGTQHLKETYHVLGEDVEIKSSGYRDVTLTTNIATLNVLGKPFLDELHKNGTFFPTEIEEYLEKKFKWLERDKKIDDIIN